MKRNCLLTSLVFILAGCTVDPSRIDNIPDPRTSSEHRAFVGRGGIADFPLDEQIHFKPGRPASRGDFNDSVVAGGPKFDYLDGFLVIAVHTPEFKIKVSGFTDALECKAEGCRVLSQRRADLVYSLLLKKGVPAEKIEPPLGYGNDMPITLNESDEDRARERRVELTLN